MVKAVRRAISLICMWHNISICTPDVGSSINQINFVGFLDMNMNALYLVPLLCSKFMALVEAEQSDLRPDTPRQDTSGPSLNILIKLMAVESLVFAPFFQAHTPDGLIFRYFK